MRSSIYKMSGVTRPGFFGGKVEVRLYDLGYEYTETESIPCGFPCNIYYDRKAWKWLVDNISTLEKPVLFWNIGA